MSTSTRNGYDHELEFWRGFVKDPRFLNGWLSDARTPDLQPYMYEWFLGATGRHTRVLDVGSGVVSILQGTVPNANLCAVDPLAAAYEDLFDYSTHDVVQPMTHKAEDLPVEWDDAFNIVHMSNALDHTENPIRAIQSLLRVTKPGGYVVIEGFENEGSFEKWEGLHQWNIRIDPSGFLRVANKQDAALTVVPEKYGARPHYGMTEKLQTGKRWLIWIIQKSL
jgi:SAM-dependent methyltransferase